MLRVLGTFSVQPSVYDLDDSFPDESSNESVSDSSTSPSTLRLFIGSSPVRFRKETQTSDTPQELKTPAAHTFHSVIIEQSCSHFFSKKNSCQSGNILPFVLLSRLTVSLI